MEKILIVDDVEINLTILQELLKDKYITFTATDGVEALDMIKKNKPDIILLDIMMPNMDGLTLCNLLKQDKNFKDIIIIFITALDKQDDIVRGFECGGQDYISKPIKVREVLARIRLHLDLKKTKELLQLHIEKLEDKNQELQEMVNIDYLTELSTRRYILECIHKELSRVNRNMSKFSLLMADIDYFKVINDNYGHESGDIVLQGTAAMLKEMLRNHDVISRWGGEEFLVLLPETTVDTAAVVAEKIRKCLEDKIFQLRVEEISLTLTIGVLEYDPSLSIEENINNVDKALYAGKLNGRNQVVMYDEYM